LRLTVSFHFAKFKRDEYKDWLGSSKMLKDALKSAPIPWRSYPMAIKMLKELKSWIPGISKEINISERHGQLVPLIKYKPDPNHEHNIAEEPNEVKFRSPDGKYLSLGMGSSPEGLENLKKYCNELVDANKLEIVGEDFGTKVFIGFNVSRFIILGNRLMTSSVAQWPGYPDMQFLVS
jgi:hypothetical protein